MFRLKKVYLLGAFVVLSVFPSSLRAEVPVWIPKDARSYRSIENEGTDRETFTRATVYRMRDGKFYVAVSAPPPKHEWECDGIGELERDGWIHFPWSDNFRRKGIGAVHFLDHGTKLAVNTNCSLGDSPSELSKGSWVLPWTGKPVLVDVRTAPHGYLIRLPAAYENKGENFNYVTLTPQNGGKVKVIGGISLVPRGDSNGVFLLTTGIWGDGDRLIFTFSDNQTKDRGEGIIHFLSSDKIVLTLKYTFTQNPKRKAQAREFNAKKLLLLRNRDRMPWEIAGMGEGNDV